MTDLPHVGLYRKATILGLVAASLLFVADNLLHPKEYPFNHEARQLHVIADHYTRWQVAHALAIGTIFLFTAALLGLTFLVRRRAPTLGLFAGVIAVSGAIGLAMILGLDGYSWAIVGEVSARGDTHTTALVLHDLQQSSWSYAYYLPGTGFLVGMILLAVALGRTGAVPLWAAVLFGLGGLLTGLEGTIHSNAFFLTGAVVLAIANCVVAGYIARMSDGEFASGGPPRAQAGIGSSASAP